MYKLSEKTKNNINEEFLKKIGITYDEFQSLDFDVQQKYMKKIKKIKSKNKKTETVMIETGEHAIFTEMNRGENYMLDDGTIVSSGLTPEYSKKMLEDRFDDAFYSKPVAFVKKIERKIKNRLF